MKFNQAFLLISIMLIFASCSFSSTENKQMPDTLDLVQRGVYALNALGGTVDPNNHCEFMFRGGFKPPMLREDAFSFSACGPKYIESWAMMRLMTGSDSKEDMENCATGYMLSCLGDDGLFYCKIGPDRPWDQTSPEDWANIYGQGRMLRAMLAQYQYDNNPEWLGRMATLVKTLEKIAIYKDDYAYYPTSPGYGDIFSYPKSGWKVTELLTEKQETQADMPDHTFGIPLYIGGVVPGLVNYYKLTGDKDALELAGKLIKFLLKPESGWMPDAVPKGVMPSEHGWFRGHFHAHTMCLRAIMDYGEATNDMKLLGIARDGYEYARVFGIQRLGWFQEYTGKASHETCGLANMMALAVKLTRFGVGDYWEDVDCYARNHLVEAQYVDMEPAKKANENLTKEQSELLDRMQGSFAGWGSPDNLATGLMNCCLANGSQALYYAWDSITDFDGKAAANVNLLMNRLSPWVDIESYLPYEGKVVIQNKKAKKLNVRIPLWVDMKKVQVMVNKKPAKYGLLGRYVMLDVKPKQTVTITFPMVVVTEHYYRGTEEYGKGGYDITFKGNTAVDISPRIPNEMYPIYKRKYYLADKSPMKDKPEYVAEKRIDW